MKAFPKLSVNLFGLFILSLFATCRASNITTLVPSAEGCVSASGFETCLQAADAVFDTCVAGSLGSSLVLLACAIAGLEQYLNCYLTDCWNKVYSCIYQGIAVELVGDVGLAPSQVPFFPAPDNAPGGCSCNVGELYENFSAAINQVASICEKQPYGSIHACNCCAWSAGFASYYALCPDTVPNPIKLPNVISDFHVYESYAGNCTGKYDPTSCESQFGLLPAPSGLALSDDNLPSWTGTKALSNTAGAGSITSPLGGPTLTWSGYNYVFTVTAVSGSVSTVKGTSPSTIAAGPTQASSSGSVAGGTSSTSSTGAAATSAKTGSGAKLGTSKILLVLVAAGLLNQNL